MILLFRKILLLLLIRIFQQVLPVLSVLDYPDYPVDQLHQWLLVDQMDQYQ
jgi:hypothetical protein